MSNYTNGKQPCQDFQPELNSNEYAMWANEHECLSCAKANSAFAKVSFCTNCHHDHHAGGWDKHAKEDNHE